MWSRTRLHSNRTDLLNSLSWSRSKTTSSSLSRSPNREDSHRPTCRDSTHRRNPYWPKLEPCRVTPMQCLKSQHAQMRLSWLPKRTFLIWESQLQPLIVSSCARFSIRRTRRLIQTTSRLSWLSTSTTTTLRTPIWLLESSLFTTRSSVSRTPSTTSTSSTWPRRLSWSTFSTFQSPSQVRKPTSPEVLSS